MCCIACCWKSRLTPAVLYWKRRQSPCRDRTPPRPTAPRRAFAPCVRAGILAHFMVRLYIAVVCKWQPTVLSYGEALADRIVSYRIAIFCLISYRIYRFLLWLYRAITTHMTCTCQAFIRKCNAQDTWGNCRRSQLWMGRHTWLRASRTAGHTSLNTCLHSSYAAAGLIYSPAFCCHPVMKEIEQDATVPSGNQARPSMWDDYVTTFHFPSCLLAGCLSMTCSHVAHDVT